MKKFLGITVSLLIILQLMAGSMFCMAAEDSPIYPPITFSFIPEAIPGNEKSLEIKSEIKNSLIENETIIYM